MKFLFAVFVANFFVPDVDAVAVFCYAEIPSRLLRNLEDDDWRGTLESCSEVEYETALFVHKHVIVVLTPVLQGNSDCPNLAMEQSDNAFENPTDADFGIRSLNVHELSLPNGVNPRDLPHLSIGTFPLTDIAKAFHTVQAQVASDPDSMKQYDIIMDNCGDFPARMMTQLKVDFDHEMVQYLAKRLQKTHHTLPQDIRSNRNAMNLIANRNSLDELTDLQLIELLVESKVKHLYDSSTKTLSEIYNDPSQDEGHHRRVLSATDEVAPPDRRLDEVDCGQWYSSSCLAETDIRYDASTSNAIADQNPAWKKFEGFYEATATTYGPDGRVLEPSFLDEGAISISPDQTPYSQAPYKMFINITLSGSRLYEQMIAIYPPPSEAFCNQFVPEGKQNVLLPGGECGWSGTTGFYERFGTSTFEKDGGVNMLPYGSTMLGTKLDRESYVSLPAGESNHLSSYLEGDVLVQYASACLDAECGQLSTTVDYYNTATPEGEEYRIVGSTRIFATRVASSTQFLDALNVAYDEYNVPTDQRPFEGGCLSGQCPEESDWCEYDPECAVSPYLEPEASILAGPVTGIVVAVMLTMFIALFALHRHQMKQKEAKVRDQFANRIAERITVTGNSRSFSPDELAAEFHKIDQDKGGSLEKEEIWAFLESGKVGSMSLSDFELLFSVIDIDRSGSVDFNEFVSFFAKCDKDRIKADGFVGSKSS